MPTFTEHYLDYVKTSCESGYCYPQPGMVEKCDGSLIMHAFMLTSRELLSKVTRLARDPQTAKLAFGFDRST